MHFVEHFRQYLYGRHFVIQTDPSSLKRLWNFKNIDGMLARSLTAIDRYDYTIVHRKGDHHRNAHGLSRIPTRMCPWPECSQCTIQDSPAAILIPEVSSEETEDGNSRDPVQETEAAWEKWLEGWTMEELREWQKADTHFQNHCMERVHLVVRHGERWWGMAVTRRPMWLCGNHYSWKMVSYTGPGIPEA